jgi:hypothetical protein
MKWVCANCGIEFNWQPTVVDGVAYCCLGCSQGGPCSCDYNNLPQPDNHTALVSLPRENDECKFTKRSVNYGQDCWY